MRGPEKVCDRVYVVGGPELSSPRDCCVYLVDCAGPLCLVDSGCGPGYKSIVANIIRLGFEPEDIEWLLLTHCHIDHAGAAHLFREEFGVRIVAHALEAKPLEDGDRLMTAAFLYGVPFEPLPLDRRLEGERDSVTLGDLDLEVLLTPGHSPGSVAAYLDRERVRVLFGQDIHGPFHPDFGSDVLLWRASMAKLLELDADILCEGHFGIYSPADAVRAYIEGYLEQFRPDSPPIG